MFFCPKKGNEYYIIQINNTDNETIGEHKKKNLDKVLKFSVSK